MASTSAFAAPLAANPVESGRVPHVRLSVRGPIRRAKTTTDFSNEEIALHNKRSLLLAALLFSVVALPAAEAQVAKDSSSPCASFINSDFPKAVLSNGSVQAVVYLPDTQKGYYRSTRFDWSGVVPCLTYKGHTYFGVWFNHYDPLINDAITGPVEEFRSSDGLSSINYNEAKPGELFLKPESVFCARWMIRPTGLVSAIRSWT